MNQVSLTEADQFRAKAIKFIGNIVKSRGYCLKHEIGKPVSKEKFKQLKTNYYTYRNRWKPAGIAWFIIRRQEDLLDFLPGGEKEVQKFFELIEIAKKYAV
jgi:hypothetical protein